MNANCIYFYNLLMFTNPTGYSQGSQGLDSSRIYSLKDEVVKIDNGGLFSQERCRNLAKYFFNKSGKCLIFTMTIKMESSKLSQLVKCSWISTGPWTRSFIQPPLTLLHMPEFSTEKTKARSPSKIWKDSLSNIIAMMCDHS